MTGDDILTAGPVSAASALVADRAVRGHGTDVKPERRPHEFSEATTLPPSLVSDPVFVVGSGRCGSTLLRLILNAHSQLAVCGELHFYDQICRLRKRLRVLEDERSLERAAQYVKRTVAYLLLQDGPAILDRAVRHLRGRIPCSFEQLHGALMRAYGDLQNKEVRRFGEKNPANVMYLEKLRQNFPGASFIHIVRDPRAVVASTINVEGTSNDVLIHSLMWRASVFCARRFKAAHPDALIEVRYEDLVQEPEVAVRRLARFLGLPFEDGMLGFHRDADRSVRISDEPWKSGVTRPVYRSSVEKWKTELDSVQIRLIEHIAGRYMREYDYPPCGDARVGWPAQLIRLIPELKKYVSAKLAANSHAPVGAVDVVESEQFVRLGILLRSVLSSSD